MILIIAEKELAGRNIARILSFGKYVVKSYGDVRYFEWTNSEKFILIPLKGHIVDIDFPEKYRSWKDSNVFEMLESKVVLKIKDYKRYYLLKKFAKFAREAIIATDYDREGELIGLEAVNIIKGVNPNLKIKRAIFSAITKEEIKRAFSNLTEINYSLAFSALARREIDLFYGALLTRKISLITGNLGRNFLSVGRVQTPTLALIVDLEEKIRNFRKEKFYVIIAKVEYNNEVFYAKSEKKFKSKEEAKKYCNEKEGTVVFYNEKIKTVKRPKPFNTTLFLSEAHSKIGIEPSKAMEIAERLYMKGLISYPRTDNQSYYNVNLPKILNEVKKIEKFSKYVNEILKEGINPEEGKKSEDHPPIHAVKAVNLNYLKGKEREIYELILRRFLATLYKEGIDEVKKGKIRIANIYFVCDGKKVVRKGWREIYYCNIEEKYLPKLKVGDKVKILSFEIKEEITKPPKRYSYSSIVKKMEELSLGTKSTRAEILKKLVDRKYITGKKSLKPTLLGENLIKTLRNFSKEITSEELTAYLERRMKEIEEGKVSKEEVIKESKKKLGKILEEIEKAKENIILKRE